MYLQDMFGLQLFNLKKAKRYEKKV